MKTSANKIRSIRESVVATRSTSQRQVAQWISEQIHGLLAGEILQTKAGSLDECGTHSAKLFPRVEVILETLRTDKWTRYPAAAIGEVVGEGSKVQVNDTKRRTKLGRWRSRSSRNKASSTQRPWTKETKQRARECIQGSCTKLVQSGKQAGVRVKHEQVTWTCLRPTEG